MRLLSMIFDFILKFFGFRKVTDLKGKSGDPIRKKWHAARSTGCLGILTVSILIILSPFFITNPIPENLSFTASNFFAKFEANEIMRAYTDFLNNYGCVIPVRIEPFEPTVIDTRSDGSQRVSYEEASQGFIRIAKGTNLYLTTLHALTHACVEKDVYLSQPFFIEDGSRIDGYIGANVKVVTIHNEYTNFTQLDEAIAEYLKINIVKTQESGLGANYYNTLCIFEYLWPKDISPKELSSMVQNSELPKILSHIYGRNITEINPNIILVTFQIFDTSRDKVIPCAELKSKVDQLLLTLE